MHINVCICTFQRPLLLNRLLTELAKQKTNDLFTYSAIITDNDPLESARKTVEAFIKQSSFELLYTLEPRKSISYARNKGLEYAKGDAIAFIDDDEFPSADWLVNMYNALINYNAAGVFGPVRSHFDTPPPKWFTKGRFLVRPEHTTGLIMPWNECRTGNVLMKRDIIDGLTPVFAPSFGAGASDIDLFRRLIEKGLKFIWCNEAPVFEVVMPNRWTRGFMIRRALLRGKISLLHPKGRGIAIVKSLIAVPAYCFLLPIMLLFGHHHFMNYLVRLCDHAGKLLALAKLNPVNNREM